MKRLWVHFHVPHKPGMRLSDLPKIPRGITRTICLVNYSKTCAINSERNAQNFDNPRMIRNAMQNLEDHFNLCDRIDDFKRKNPGKLILVHTYKGKYMKTMNIKPFIDSSIKPFTKTSWRHHSETHFDGIVPSEYFLSMTSVDKDGKRSIHINNIPRETFRRCKYVLFLGAISVFASAAWSLWFSSPNTSQ